MRLCRVILFNLSGYGSVYSSVSVYPIWVDLFYMVSSAPRRIPCSSRLSRVNRLNPSRFHLISRLAGVQSRQVSIRTRVPHRGFSFGDCSSEARLSQKVKNTKTRVTPTMQEKALEPPENRDLRRKSNASRVGGGVHIHAYSHSIYSWYTRSFFSPAPRRATLSGAAAIQLLISSLSLSLSLAPSLPPPLSLSLSLSLLSFSSSAAERRAAAALWGERKKTLKEDLRSRARVAARQWTLDSRTVSD